MSYLLDTHAFIWRMRADPRLPVAVSSLLDRTTEPVLLSAISVYELTYKHRLGRLGKAEQYVRDLIPIAVRERFVPFPLTPAHAFAAARLATDHRDPFDRMLFAQALEDDLTFLSNEQIADTVGVRRLW